MGHINQDGYKDNMGCKIYRKIVKGIRKVGDLKIECVNCNCCLEWYHKYPDEITIDDFLFREL